MEPEIRPSLFWMRVAAIAGFSAVTLGAFGAHGLKQYLSPYGQEIYHTAVLYHLIHAAVLVGLAQRDQREWNHTCLWIALGILLFSGSLYVLALTEIKKLGMITPFGGVCFLIGWFLLFKATFAKKTH